MSGGVKGLSFLRGQSNSFSGESNSCQWRSNSSGDTIVAISTPVGEGGIGIVRMSGPESISIADRIFYSPKGLRPSLSESHKLIYGFIIDPSTGERIDEVLLAVMRAPRTYTREDIVEINCHGGYIVLKRVLELAISLGARPALPGEFTMRAFLNGRIDLTQAEAVLDLIRAKTEQAERVALDQLTGTLRKKIEDLTERLKDIVIALEAYIDFPEEDISTDSVSWVEGLEEVIKELSELSRSFYEGRMMREGVSTVIAGRPNVGKSSLLNALTGLDRAIVTEIPGTTRDIIEEVLNIKGMPLRLIDTAGIREAKDIVEREGIRRTEAAIEKAELVLLVVDGSEELTEYDRILLERLRAKQKKTIVVLNKKDLGIIVKRDQEPLKGWPVIEVSATKGYGLEELKELIFETLTGRSSPGSIGSEAAVGTIITRARHKALIDECLRATSDALKSLNLGEPLEIVAFNLRSAIQSLNEITGLEFSDEDILRRIFSEFCIGK